jgi:hypothetical protein
VPVLGPGWIQTCFEVVRLRVSLNRHTLIALGTIAIILAVTLGVLLHG